MPARIALGIGASRQYSRYPPERLSYLHDHYSRAYCNVYFQSMTIGEELAGADLVIGAVLIPGAPAPKLVTRSMLKRMRPGSRWWDISVDQGGVLRRPALRIMSIRPTSKKGSSLLRGHIPGAFPEPPTFALTNATFPNVLQIADKAIKGNGGK